MGSTKEDFHKSKRFSEEDFEKISKWDWFLAKNSKCYSIIFIAYRQK